MSKNEDEVTVVLKDPSSRLCSSPKHIFEVFTEYVFASVEKPNEPKLLQIFPKDYEWDQDTKKNFPKFCFPCKPFTVAKAQRFTFTLTDIDGNYRFGFCYYPKGTNCYKCYCFFSYLPWFEFFYWALETISEFKKDVTEAHKVEPFLLALHEHGIPDINSMEQETPTISVTPQGSLSQTYKFSLPHPLKSPSLPKDHNLNLMYTNLSHEVIIAIFASAIFERRIIMHSNSLSLLSACIHATDILLYPLHWQHIFCPIMPPSLMDYCCAPMPFLMGIHKSLMEDVLKMPIDDVVLVDLDDNQLESPYLHLDLEGFPASSLHSLEKVLKKPSSTQGDSVAKAFLDMFVAIIGGYQSALKLRPGDKEISFDQDLFVKSRANISSLLENLLQFQHFQQFINGRIQRKKGSGMNRDRFDDALNAWEDTPVKKTNEAESLKEGILLAMKVTKKGISKGGVILHKKGGQMISKWQEQLSSTKYGEKEPSNKRQLERSVTQVPSAVNPTDLYFRDPEAVRRLVQVKQAHLNKTPPPVPKSYQRHRQERDSVVELEIERSIEISKSSDSNTLPNLSVTKASTTEPPVANLVSFSPPPTPPPRRRGRQRANAQSQHISVDALLIVPNIPGGDTLVDSPDVISPVSEGHSSSDDVDSSSTTSSSSCNDVVVNMMAPPLPPRDELMENTYVTMLQSENVDLSSLTGKVPPPLPPRDHDDLPIPVLAGNPPPLPPRDLLGSPIPPDSMLPTKDLPKPISLPPRGSNTPPVPPRDKKKNSPKLPRQTYTPPTQPKNAQPLAHCNSTEMQRKFTQSPDMLMEMEDKFPTDGFCVDISTEFGQSVARELLAQSSRSSFTEDIAKKLSSSCILRPSKAVMQTISGDDPFASSLPPPLIPSSSSQSENTTEQPSSTTATSNPLDSLLNKNDLSKYATTTSHSQQEKLEDNNSTTTPNGNVLTS